MRTTDAPLAPQFDALSHRSASAQRTASTLMRCAVSLTSIAAAVFAMTVVAMTFVAAIPALAADAPASTPRDLQPYRVRTSLGISRTTNFSPVMRQSLLADVAMLTDRYVGQMWQLQVVVATGPLPTTLPALERVSVTDCLAWTAPIDNRAAQDLAAQHRAAAAATESASASALLDKLFLLVLETEGSGYRVAGREFDTATRELSAVHQRIVYDYAALPQAVLELLHTLFRPVSNIEVDRAKSVFVRAYAGDLPPPDPAWSPLQTGQWLQPFHRTLDPQPDREPVQSVPWTYLKVQDPSRAVAPCDVVTGLRAPFNMRRRKVETLALAARPQTDRTQLTLLTRRPSERRLGGIDVDVHQKLPQSSTTSVASEKTPASPEKTPAPRRLVSDRDGTLDIPVDPAHPQVWLYLRSGQALLARLPFVPGLVDAARLELPDDALRLSVEGQVSLLQAELVDTVARRAVHMARIRQRARAGQWTEVDMLLKDLDKIPKLATFKTRLNALRLNSLKAAENLKDRATAARITQLCDESAELMARYLDQDKLTAFREELDELREIQAK